MLAGTISALKTEFESVTTELLNTISAFSEEELNTIPHEGSWTAGQVAQHLNKSYDAYQVLFGPVEPTGRKPDEMVEPIKSDFLNFSIKMKSPEFIIPEDKHYERNILIASLDNKRLKILEALQTLDLTMTCTSFNFPDSGALTRWEWINFILFHTQRHLYQLRNILQEVKDKNSL